MAVDSIQVSAWVSFVHAEKLQEDDFKKMIARDDMLEPVTVNLIWKNPNPAVKMAEVFAVSSQ